MTDTTRVAEPFAMLPVSVLLDTSLSDKAIRLYALLVHYVGKKDSCWPSQSRLAREMGTSRSSIQRTLDELVSTNLIAVKGESGRTCHYSLTCVTHDAPPASPVTHPPASPMTHKQEPVEQEPREQEVAMRQTDRPEPITDDWTPDTDVMDRLASDCQGLVNIDRSLRRFRNYYIEKGVRSKAWDHKFEAWVLNDIDKAEASQPPPSRQSPLDDLGLRHDDNNGMDREQRLAEIAERERRHAELVEKQGSFEEWMARRQARTA